MKYKLDYAQQQRLKDWTYHKPVSDQPKRYDAINAATRDVAKLLMHCCPKGSRLDKALDYLEDARMWANSSIACTELEEEDPADLGFGV